MNQSLSLILAVLACATRLVTAAPPVEGWPLAFSDEFNGGAADLDRNGEFLNGPSSLIHQKPAGIEANEAAVPEATADGMEHMQTWAVAYSIDGVRDWLFTQHK